MSGEAKEQLIKTLHRLSRSASDEQAATRDASFSYQVLVPQDLTRRWVWYWSLAALSDAWRRYCLVRRLQHVVRDVDGARHDLISVVLRLRDDDRYQADGVGHFLH
jgi:hypothetical protein